MKGEMYMHYQNYTYRTGSYRKQHKRYTANRKRQEEYESPPSFLFFRLRLLICIMLFLAFVTADKYVLTKEDTAPVFQKIEKNQSYSKKIQVNWRIEDSYIQRKSAHDKIFLWVL